MAEPQLSTGKKLLFWTATLVGLPLLILVLIEGTTSLLLLGREITSNRDITERLHTEYDTLLGWIHRPEVHIPDLYGPGRGLRTNAQRFRGQHPTPVHKDPDHYRIVCAGDSFTLGVGVSDEDTWCHLLEDAERRITTVNMGQGGYGMDQAYLWYRRDGTPLEHDALLFSFITDDLRRMALDAFEGYPKPRLRLENGDLVTGNVPVPRPPLTAWRARARSPLRDLRMTEFMRRGLLALGQAPGQQDPGMTAEVEALSHRIVHELAEIGTRDERLVVLVYLPDPWDYQSDHSAPWRRHMAAAASEAGLVFLDLVEELRSLPPLEASSYYRDAHFEEAGNRWVSGTLLDLLEEVPQFQRGVAALDPAGAPASGN